ncbi:MAG: hypothetical protein KGZ65_02470 [Sphingomonadales bacterium]|nr:hypothetical protein [Sphingomonadales bacterium]
MPIARVSLGLAIAALAAGSAQGQAVNPLAGDTKAAQAPAHSIHPAPPQSRGKLEADPASGGQVFTDESGWYRFTMANGGTTRLEGSMRLFQFQSGGQKAACLSLRIANNALAKFSIQQIQAELDTLYPTFDKTITDNGLTIVARQSITLDAPGQRSVPPMRVLAWDTRDKSGLAMTYALAPLPAGQLLFACGAGSADHAREIIQRYLRLADGVVVPAR